MSFGYSQNIVAANKQANVRSIGVALGRVCIKNGVSVQEMASLLNVSRQTVYNWFVGRRSPNVKYHEYITKLLNRYK
jgi:DNA-binding transcriptional regulator YiaG